MKILAPIDGSESAYNAMRSACRIAKKAFSQVVAFYVNKGQEYTPEETRWMSVQEKLSKELEEKGQAVISTAYRIGKEMGAAVEGVISYGLPAPEILKYAGDHGIIKVIAMGHSSKGKGAQEFVESTTGSVLEKSNRPVLVTSTDLNVKSILIAVDQSELSMRVTRFGGELARLLEAELTLISVIPDMEEMASGYRQIAEVSKIEKYMKNSEKELREASDRALGSAKEILSSMKMNAGEIIRKGQPSKEIILQAGGYDLLVMGVRRTVQEKKISRMANRMLDFKGMNTLFVQ